MPSARAGVYPDLDSDSLRMATSFADIDPHANAEQRGYFANPIPKCVHQIWFGDPAALCVEGVKRWRAFSQQFGYGYRLWTEADDDVYATILSTQHYALLHEFLDCGDNWAASDLLRIDLLEQYGGVYSDLDISAPVRNGELVDLAEILPM